MDGTAPTAYPDPWDLAAHRAARALAERMGWTEHLARWDPRVNLAQRVRQGQRERRAQSARVARKGPRVHKATSPKRAPRGTAAS